MLPLNVCRSNIRLLIDAPTPLISGFGLNSHLLYDQEFNRYIIGVHLKIIVVILLVQNDSNYFELDAG